MVGVKARKQAFDSWFWWNTTSRDVIWQESTAYFMLMVIQTDSHCVLRQFIRWYRGACSWYSCLLHFEHVHIRCFVDVWDVYYVRFGMLEGACFTDFLYCSFVILHFIVCVIQEIFSQIKKADVKQVLLFSWPLNHMKYIFF